MALLNLDRAKAYFEAGLIVSFSLEQWTDGWHIYLEFKNSRPEPLLTARGEKQRLFKTLDAAINTIREIGFEASVLIGGTPGRV